MSDQKQKQPGQRIYAQLAEIMAAVEAVGKERKNQQQGFNFRGIEDVMNALHPIFAAHKVYVLSNVVEQKTEERTTKSGGNLIYRVLTVDVSLVSGEDGSRETVRVVGEGMDSGDKAANKAMSAALKYALSQTLILPFAQVDGDADAQPPSQPKTEPQRPAADKAAAEGRLTSAHDGRTMKPGESADQDKAKPTAAAAKEEPTAFHSRLYSAMALTGMTEPALKAYLVKKGIMTANGEVGSLSEKIVTLMLEGKDKASGKDNWDLICDGVKQMKGAA